LNLFGFHTGAYAGKLGAGLPRGGPLLRCCLAGGPVAGDEFEAGGSPAPTPGPTGRPSTADGCENDDAWYTKKSSRDCDWVKKKNKKKDWEKKAAKKNCKKKSDDGTKAFDACGCDACDKSRFEDADQSAADVAIIVPCALAGALLVSAVALLLRRRLLKTLQHRRCSMPVVDRP
jgi:hypothetical protein